MKEKGKNGLYYGKNICLLCGGEKREVNKREKVETEEEKKFRNNIYREIGRTIKTYRKEKNMTQSDLAKIIKTDRTVISYIETGKRMKISICYLYKIADVLDKSIHDFLPVLRKEWKGTKNIKG